MRREFRQASQASNVLRGALGALGVTAIANSFRTIVTRSAELGATLVEQSQVLGLSVEAFQELGRTFESDGVRAEQFRTAMTALQRRLGDLQRGTGESLATWEQLGITWEEVANTPLDRVLERVADGIARIEDPNLRAAAALRLFEESGTRLLPVLNRGAAGIQEARSQQAALGVTSTETATILKALGQDFTDFGNQVQDAFNEVAAAYRDEIRDALIQIADGVRVITDLIVRVEPAVNNFIRLVGQFGAIATLAPGLARVIGAVARAFSRAGSGVMVIRGQFSRALPPLRAFLTTLPGLAQGLSRLFFGVVGRWSAAIGSIVIGFDLLYEYLWRRIPEGAEQSITSIGTLQSRIGELQRRIESFTDEEIFGFVPTFGIEGAFNRLTGVVQEAQEEIDRLQERIVQIGAAGRLAPPGLPEGYDRDTGRVTARAEAIREETVATEEAVTAAERYARFIGRARLEALRVEVPAPEVAPAVDALEQVVERMNEATRQALRNVGDISSELRRLQETRGATDAFLQGQLLTAGLEQSRQALDTLAESGRITEATARATLIVNERLTSLARERLTASGMERDRIDELISQLSTRYPEIVAQIAEAFDGLQESVQRQTGPLVRLADAFGDSLERGIRRAVREGGKLRDIMAQIGREILGGILSAITRLATNALLGAIGIPGRQFGGPVRRGRPYIVGERGPELFVPAASGRIQPNASAGNVIQFNVDARGSDRAAVERGIQESIPLLARVIGAQVQADIRFGLGNPSSIYRPA